MNKGKSKLVANFFHALSSFRRFAGVIGEVSNSSPWMTEKIRHISRTKTLFWSRDGNDSTVQIDSFEWIFPGGGILKCSARRFGSFGEGDGEGEMSKSRRNPSFLVSSYFETFLSRYVFARIFEFVLLSIYNRLVRNYDN